MMSAGFLLLSLSLVLLSDVSFVSTDYAEKVKTTILNGYDRGLRPRCPPNDVTNVTLDVAVRQVLDLDERNQIMHLSAWIRLSWIDCRLVWNATEYGNLSSLVLFFSDIWTPDLTIYDSVKSTLDGLREFRPYVHSDGIVKYNFPSITETLCPIDVQFFPFDTQSCRLIFGSWASHGGLIDFHSLRPHGDLTSSKLNVEWEEMSFGAARHVLYYACCPEPYPDVTFTLTLRRKPAFYVNNIIIPSMLITVVCFLGFILPVESGEKISLEVTILLSLAVFQLLVADLLPPDSKSTPFISQYFKFGLFVIAFAITLTVIVLYVHHKGNVPVPRRVRALFFWYLAGPTFVYVPGAIKTSSKEEKIAKTYKVQHKHDKENGVSDQATNRNGTLQDIALEETTSEQGSVAPSHEEEWRLVARILERIFLIVIFLTCVIGTTMILLKMLMLY